MESRKELYKQVCETHSIPIFSQGFWLDLVCGRDNWDVLFAIDNGNIIGSLAYYIERKEGFAQIRKAPLTQNNGVLFFYPKKMKYERKVAFEHKVSKLIIDQIENIGIDNFRQYFHHSFTNWLQFYWHGYKQSTRYTYILEDTGDLDVVENNFHASVRNTIRKAEKIVIVKEDLASKDFYSLNKNVFDRQNVPIPYSYDFFNNFYMGLKDRGVVKIYYAVDQEANIHSTALFVIDDTTVYYLMSGMDENFKESQSLTLLIFEGIKLANRLNKKFDFEGSMKENLESFIRKFGAKQVPYFDINKKMEAHNGI